MGSHYAMAFSGFIIVLGLMGLTLFLLKKLMSKMNQNFSNEKRINIIETFYLDPKRKLVLVQLDNKQHLLLIGGANDIVVEKNIEPKTIKKEIEQEIAKIKDNDKNN